MGIVVTGARELCEAVETVGAGCRDFVMCRGQRGEVCVPGVRFAGARLAEGNNPGVWIEGRVLLAGALRVVDIVLVEVPVPVPVMISMETHGILSDHILSGQDSSTERG